ncbi:hypothetical protein [Desulfobacter sp.]
MSFGTFGTGNDHWSFSFYNSAIISSTAILAILRMVNWYIKNQAESSARRADFIVFQLEFPILQVITKHENTLVYRAGDFINVI